MEKWVGVEEYPQGLREIAWVPRRLYYEGDLGLLCNERNIAVVGTRRMSEYGREVTEIFSRELTKAGWVIVSGLARGVDRVAHETCLANGGRTIAVLAHGLGMTYPPEHAELRKKIVERGGLVVSEHPEKIGLTKQQLAVRNRITVAISKCVLVTESPKSSGTKITVKYAAEQGKDVFIVPGPVNDPTYEGSVELMREGCIPVAKASEIGELNL